MEFLNRMTVFKRVMFAFMIVLAMSCFLGIFSIFEMARVNDTTNEIKNNWLPSVRFSMEMRNNLSAFRSAELQHILSVSPEDMDKYEKRMSKALADYRGAEEKYVPLISEPEEKMLYGETQKLMEQYLAVHERVLELSRKQENDAALALMRGDSIRLRNEVDQRLAKIVEVNVAGSDRSGKQAEDVYLTARTLILSVLGATTMLGVALAFVFARNLVRQLGGEPAYAAEVAGQVAAGNLAVEVQLRPGDTSSMLYAMSRMRRTLADIVLRIKASSEAVATASGQIAQGNMDLSQRTEEQASALEETAASMEELTVTVKQNADNAGQANRLALSASGIAERGGHVVGQVVTTMHDIATNSTRIVDIISVIEGIAFQTNILALNAAVEAARAGEQGRGFAVVAGEVRSLAQRSAAAAKEIKELIEGSVQKVDKGSTLVDEAGKTMEEIVRAVKHVTDIMADISAASAEQTSGIEQVGSAVAQIDKVTQENAALVEEAAAAAASLNEQSQQLLDAVSVFRLGAERTDAFGARASEVRNSFSKQAGTVTA
ncbi:methyl-accepting chemotaxis protein [Cupriavidus sp. WKF15]|uniref:methyl-accepting chemotaxis protein n=1 Tax=Cupriavidus sp. WKF15 TaxID=3032282 RepID=UPI0023E1A407|nr:methyl-accepting chemotaxis protein [Cupriavidus sp. WKF15]WER49909.1 methyl-accepting chemotaxis protein [Cupriavidus sp. WKF15]